MAFQIKDFASIAASCINWTRAVTTKVSDFNVGSVVRSMIEAFAVEMDELYQRMFIGLKEAIPVSVYNSFSFDALPAQPASGQVRVTITSSAVPVTIAAGTLLTPSVGTVQYEVSKDTVIPAGNTFADVSVVATVAGAVGNLAALVNFTMTPAPSAFVSAQSLRAMINGQDVETDDQRKLRFAAFIDSLNRGTVAALRYGIRSFAQLFDSAGSLIERAALVAIVEPWVTDSTQPISLVNVYVHNGVGATSSALLDQTRAVIYGYTDANGVAVPGWKAAGVRVDVFAATEVPVAVTGALTALPGYQHADLVTAAVSAITAYLLQLDIGVSAVRSELIAAVMNIDGVYNFVPSAPAGDTTAAANAKIMPGVITIT